MSSPNININAVPCADPSHFAVSSNTELEMHIRANCKVPKMGKQVKEGRYWTLVTCHQTNAIAPGALKTFHQSAADAWKKGLYPKSAGSKGNFGVMSIKDSTDEHEDWELVEKKHTDEEDVKSASGKHVHCLQSGLQ